MDTWTRWVNSRCSSEVDSAMRRMVDEDGKSKCFEVRLVRAAA